MPASGGYTDREIVSAVRSGALDEAVLDKAVIRLLTLIDKATVHRKPGACFDKSAHHALARRAAGESAVLLKNDDNLLPLSPKSRVALIGRIRPTSPLSGERAAH